MSEAGQDDAAQAFRPPKLPSIQPAERSRGRGLAAPARAHELLATVAARTVDETRDQVANARALADQAKVEVGYSQVFAPVSGKVNVRATRQGEVVAAALRSSPSWTLRRLGFMRPSLRLRPTLSNSRLAPRRHALGRPVQGKSSPRPPRRLRHPRDVSSRKRDIKTIQLKLLIDNPGERSSPA